MITSVSSNLLDINSQDILTAKSLNRKCEMLLSQIEELKHNYHSMVMNKYNREYTIINGQRLTHIVPYKSEREYNVEKCKAVCSSDNNCYGFNKTNSYSWFSKPRVQCDYISKHGAQSNKASMVDDAENKLYITMNDENIKSTERILETLISDFFSSCSRGIDIVEAYTGMDDMATNDSSLSSLKSDLTQQQQKMKGILNDLSFVNKEYSDSSVVMSHNNVMLSIYSIIVVILIIVAVKSIINI